MAEEITLTESSYHKLKEELDHMKTVKRAEIAEAIRKARAYGDLSENFEYAAARRDQGILNGKIAEIERRLEIAKVVPDNAVATDGAGLGSVVTVRDLDTGDEWDYVLTDAASADPVNDRISIDSPVGKALRGHNPADTVEAEIPAGTARYEILAVRQE